MESEPPVQGRANARESAVRKLNRLLWRTATVAAGSYVDSNIAATAGIVLGGLAISWLETRKRLEAPPKAF